MRGRRSRCGTRAAPHGARRARRNRRPKERWVESGGARGLASMMVDFCDVKVAGETGDLLKLPSSPKKKFWHT